MRKLIKIVSILGVLLIALIIAGVAILQSMDFNEYRPMIAEKAKQATGRDLTITGDLDLKISLTPSIAVNGVTFSNATWGSEPNMFSLDSFAAEVELLPLLNGEILIKRVVLQGVRVLLETDSKGTANWQFDGGSTTAGTDIQNSEQGSEQNTGQSSESSDITIPVINSLQIHDVTIIYKDGVSGESQSLSLPVLELSSTGSDSPMQLVMEAAINQEIITIKGDIGSVDVLSNNRMFPLKLDMSVLGSTLVLDGTIANPQAGKGFNMGFSLKGDNLGAVAARAMALAGVTGDTGLTANSFSVDGAFRDSADGGFAVDGLRIKIGGSDLGGNLSLNISDSVPAISASLISELFDLADVIKQSDEKPTQTSTQTQSTASGSAKPDDGRVFPADALVLDGLKAVNAEIDFSGRSLIAQDMKLSDINLVLALKDGRLSLSTLQAVLAGGKIDGTLALDGTGAKAKLDLALKVSQLDYGQIYKQSAGDDMIRGKADLDINIKANGSSVRSLMAGMNGKLRVSTRDGYIDSGALAFATGPLAALFEGEEAKILRCAVVDFDIVNGMANSKATVFETGVFSIVGEGKLDLRDEKLDMRFDPRAKTASLMSVAEIGIIASGTFKEPSIGPDAADVAMGVASIAAGIATGGLSSLLGAVVGAAVDATDNTDYCALALAGKPLKAQK